MSNLSEAKPNFVLIFGETQGANVIGAYGQPGVETPNIDQLAQNATLFTRGYTTCPLCTPARAGLFSGMYSHTSGPWTNNLPLGDNVLTMGQRFRDAGYQTAYSGKWHLDGHDYFGTGICPDGWNDQYWYDGRRYLEDLTEQEIFLWRKGLATVEALQEHDVQPEFTWGHRITSRAIEFLENRAADTPFLLVAAYDEPHHPFTCPPNYAVRFSSYRYPVGPGAQDTLENKPAFQKEWAASSQPLPDGVVTHPLYFGCNSFIDAEYGRLLEAVHQFAPDNTYIIFTTDHGDLLGAHQLWGKGPAMYEEITHIPMIIQQPGGTGAGTRNPTPVSHIDLLPTMLSLAGLAIPPILEGESLEPYLHGAANPERDVIIEFNRYEIEHDSWGGFQPIRCIVSGQYKLAINLLDTDEFYDLQADPAEVTNLIDHPDYTSQRDALHARLLDWMYLKRDPFRGPAWERRPWQFSRKLTWQGYFRPRPADGYAPGVRSYDTGMPARGVKIEHEPD